MDKKTSRSKSSAPISGSQEGVHDTLTGLLQIPASQKQVGTLENTLEAYLWLKLHQSTLILPSRHDEKRRKEIVTHFKSGGKVD